MSAQKRPKHCCSTGGRRGVQRKTTWAQVSVYRERRTDRAKGRCAYCFARQRTEPEWLLSGHDEPVPAGDSGAGENFGRRRFFSRQRKDRLFANENGRGRRLPGNG